MAKDLSFLTGTASEVAPRLLGCILEHHIDGRVLRGKIVETEAYDQTDVASHSYNGETPRTKVMFGAPGHLYVYFTYGMHYCCNVVVGREGEGAAVLIRAIEPLEGVEYMERRRQKSGIEATNGPAKLCQAMAIDKAHNGANLTSGSVVLTPQPALESHLIAVAKRVGIRQGVDIPWRFYITGNPYVSKVIK